MMCRSTLDVSLIHAYALPLGIDASRITLPHRQLGTSTGGVELGKFRMHSGRNVFVLRRDRSSVLVTARGDTDLILDRRLHEQLKACLDQVRETGGHRGRLQ